MRIFVPAFFLLFTGVGLSVSAQDIDAIINPSVVENIEKTLSSDDMRGRASFSPDIERAADFIEAKFRAAGLKTWNGSASYRQPFVLVRARSCRRGMSLPSARRQACPSMRTAGMKRPISRPGAI
jgi:hypothetical protein